MSDASFRDSDTDEDDSFDLMDAVSEDRRHYLRGHPEIEWFEEQEKTYWRLIGKVRELKTKLNQLKERSLHGIAERFVLDELWMQELRTQPDELRR